MSNFEFISVSGDINFASDLSDLKHRKGYHVILVHSKHVHEALKDCANEHHLFEDIVKEIPRRQPDVVCPNPPPNYSM